MSTQTTHLEYDALAALPFVAADYHDGQASILYAVSSGGWTPVDYGLSLRCEAEYADYIGEDDDAETFRQAASVLDWLDANGTDGQPVATLEDNDGRVWVRADY